MGPSRLVGAEPRPMLRDRWFADSPVEGDGFERSVPHKKQPFLAAPVRSRNSCRPPIDEAIAERSSIEVAAVSPAASFGRVDDWRSLARVVGFARRSD